MHAAGSPHPESVLVAPGGRLVQLKVHRCFWSGAYPENSLAAAEECGREHVARAEVDINMLADADFLIVHDPDLAAWPWPRVEELARLVEGIHERVVFAGCPDWNLRRLLTVDPAMPVGFNPQFYLDHDPQGFNPDTPPYALG